MIRIKICGITRPEDALHAARSGADLIGMVFAPSPRQVDLVAARRIVAALESGWADLGRVGVFVNPSRAEIEEAAAAASLTHVQIHGALPPEGPPRLPWIAAIALASVDDARPPAGNPWAVLVEPKVPGMTGGTGETFPWEWARPLMDRGRVFVAGGLDAERIGSLLDMLTPFGVDASSRLESEPGIKDPDKVQAFIRAIRAHEERKQQRR
jgi:phosphoribosylanthranilate isomerase